MAQKPDKASDRAVVVARNALAARLKVAIQRIALVDVAATTWRDTSLGCPEPDTVYLPVLTPGHEVRLRADDREHVVHVAGERTVFCDRVDGVPALVADSLKASAATRTAMAQRLGVAADAVRIVSARSFGSARHTCPGAPAEPRGAAFIVEARVDGATHWYYSDDAVTRPCGE